MLETKNNKMMQKLMVMAVLMIGLFGIAANQAAAQSRFFGLYVQNIDPFNPVTITLKAGDCYQGTPGDGEIFENVASGAKIGIALARVQGHGCDGKGGYFTLTFDPSVGLKKTQNFAFSNDGGLWLDSTSNQYPGTLSAKSPQDESYTYTTFARPKLIAGKPQGSWKLLCQGNCNEEYSNAITNQTTRETTVSSETKSAVSVALEAGVEFGGASAKTTVSSSLEKTIGQSMSEGVLNAETSTRTKRVVYTPEQMNTLNIFAVWQWVASTKLSNSQMILVKSDKITCTPDGDEPTYLPGSRADVGACSGKTSASNNKPQDANPKPNPVEIPKPISNPPQTQGGIAKLTRQQLEDEFRTCPEALQYGAPTDEDFTKSLYWRYLGHAPDGNLQAHAARITNGQMTRQQLEDEFRTCSEAQQHGVSTTADFTISLYWRYLGHGPDGNLQIHANRLIG